MKTINLKGKEYAPVSARVEQFHKDYKKGTITTSYEFTNGYVIFNAIITTDEDRMFTGHAFGKIGQEKAFEKIETTAVGRALAFAGYLSGGEIASYDEVKDFMDEDTEVVPEEPVMTVADATHALHVVQSLDNLKQAWDNLPAAVKKDPEVVAKKDEMKSKLK